MTHISELPRLAELPRRSVLAVTGADRVGFLNGLVSNDVALAEPGRAVWAAMLTAQGKWLADFFVFATHDALLLDCEAAQAGFLATRLGRYRLRADVAIEPAPALRVFAGWDDAHVLPEKISAPDPRLPEAGLRILAHDLAVNADVADWDEHRLRLGLPDGSRDLETEKTVLLEAGFDELSGISWTKGCYMGQELTARTRYRGLVKRRLLPVTADGPLPPPGTPVFSEGREVGTVRSSQGRIGLALLRLDGLAGRLVAGDIGLTTRIPGWAKLPEPA